MANAELTGVVVDGPPDSPFPARSHDGLYLQTDDGRTIELICGSMAQQIAVDMMWRQSRKAFEAYLGQRVTVEGYLSRRTLYSARLVEPREA